MKRLLTLLTAVAMLAAPALAGDGASATADAFGTVCLMIAAVVGLPVALRAIGISLPYAILAATTISTTALNTAYGAKYKEGSSAAKDLRTQMFETAEFDKLFTLEYTQSTVWEKTNFTMGSILQRYQKAFTDNGTLTFTPSKYDLDKVKVDMSWVSDDIKESFVGFMHDEGKEPTAQELVAFLMAQVPKKFAEDVELYAAYGGLKGTLTPGTATSADESMDGFKKVINDGIAASTIVPIPVGAAPTDAELYVAYLEEFVAAIPNKYRRIPMQLAVNIQKEELFKEGMRLKYNTYYRDQGDVTRLYTRPNIQVVGQSAMDDSTKVFCSPKENLYKVVNTGMRRGVAFHWESVDRLFKLWGQMRMKYCIWNHEMFFTNDVEETSGS
jgi:multidrug transporter EmrE-like cation transporter